MSNEIVRALRDGLSSSTEPPSAGSLGPSGFDPSRGLVAEWDRAVRLPRGDLREAALAEVGNGLRNALRRAGGFDSSRWMELFCGLANARYGLELWEREYAVAQARGHDIPSSLIEWCRERGRRECENLRVLEALVRPVACRDSDGSPKGGDGEAGSVRSTTARAEGIAQNAADTPKGSDQ